MTIETENKERIRKEAHALMMQYGIRSVSMDDIAGKLGISKKTIYQYFEDKDELVMSMIEDTIANNRTMCDCSFSQSKDPIHEIFITLDHISEIFKTMNPSVLYDLQKYHPKAFQKLQKHKNEELYEIIKRNLENGINQGLYRENLKVDLLSRFRVASMFVPFSPEFYNGLNYTLYEGQEEILYNFLFGLVTSKGYELAMQHKQERDNRKIKK